MRDLESGHERWLQLPIQRHQLESRATRDLLPNFAITPDSRYLIAAFGGKIRRLALDGSSREIVPFEARVSLDVTERLDFPRRVPDGPVRARRPRQLALGPGDRLAVSALARIYVGGIDGTPPTRLTSAERAREFMPSWSPDGRWVAFVSWDERGGHLWKAPSGGASIPVRLSEAPALWLDPVWTPDGDRLVVLTAPLGSARSAASLRGRLPAAVRVVSLSAEGGPATTVLDEAGPRHPHFVDGSDRLYLGTSRELISVELDGSDRRTEATLEGTAAREWRASPDGREALALAGRRLLRLTLSEQGSNRASASTLTSDSPTSFAWSNSGASVAWLTGNQLHRVTGGAVAAPSELVVEQTRAKPSGTILLAGAKVITMLGDEIVEPADVAITDNRIAWIAASGSRNPPDGAEVLDLSGTVIVPGFIDVHAHFATPSDLLEPASSANLANLAFGITSLRNPQASPDIFALADIVDAFDLPSPRIFSTGPGLALGFAGGGHYAAPSYGSADQVRELLQRYRDEYDTHLIKSYLFGNRQQRQWVIEASRELGMMPTTEGGADTKGNLTHAIDGFSGNEHAFPVAPIYRDIVELVARSGMTYAPTLVVSFGGALPIYRLLAERRPHENARLKRWYGPGELYARTSSRLLWFPPESYNDRDVAAGAKAILDAGGRVALGGHGEVQGLSNHWEMELLAAGGMKPHDVLKVATIFGAEAIGYEQDLGSIESGKLADLLVLDRDPLEDIRATTAIRYVVKNGVIYEAETLDEIWPEKRALELPWWAREHTMQSERQARTLPSAPNRVVH